MIELKGKLSKEDLDQIVELIKLNFETADFEGVNTKSSTYTIVISKVSKTKK